MHQRLIHRDRPIAARIAARCRQLGFSERTRDSYTASAAHLEDWCGVPAMEASQEQCAAWLAREIDGRRRSPRSTYHERSAVSFIFRHLRDGDLDPRIVPVVRQPVPDPAEVVDQATLSRLFAAVRKPHHRLFCRFLYATGMRTREALAVQLRDLDVPGRSVRVVIGKGCHRRRTILPDGLARELGHLAWQHPDRALFACPEHADGRPMALGRIQHAWLQARRRCGLLRPLTLHHLRHCFATHLHERGVGLVELQRLLGHRSPMTTLIYIGLREQRRGEISDLGDLLSTLPAVAMRQEMIGFG